MHSTTFSAFRRKRWKRGRKLSPWEQTVDLINLLPLAFDKSLIPFNCGWQLHWYVYDHVDSSLTKLVNFSVNSFSSICNIFLQSFASKPRVFVSVKYTRSTKPNDAMYLWLENVNSGGFEVCLREFLPFDGKHQDAVVVSEENCFSKL